MNFIPRTYVHHKRYNSTQLYNIIYYHTKAFIAFWPDFGGAVWQGRCY